MTWTRIEEEVDGDVEEREGRSVVTSRFSREHMPHMCRDMFFGKLSSDDGLGENRIGGRETSGDDEGGEEVVTRQETPDEKRSDEPAPYHTWAE